MRISTLDRDLSYGFPVANHEQPPTAWTSDWVKHRLIEAFTIERRIPDRRVGPAMLRSYWPAGVVDSFADKVHQGELAREDVWRKWARAGGATAHEVSRMEEALSWPGSVWANGGGRPVEARAILAWAHCIASGYSISRLLRRHGWSRSTFYHRVEAGAEIIARHLQGRGVVVH